MSLTNLIEVNSNAAAFYRSLHPSVRNAVNNRALEINAEQDLYAIANNAMTDGLRSVGGIYDDSGARPD